MLSSEFKILLQKYQEDTITEEEYRRLWQSLGEPENDVDWHRATEEVLLNKSLHGLSDPTHAAEALNKIRSSTLIDIPETVTMEPAHTNRLFPLSNVVKYAAVALVVTAVATVLWSKHQQIHPAIVVSQPAVLPDIMPGGQKALLTLSDGSKIVLDSTANGKIAQQGHVQVIKLADGQLVYQPLDVVEGDMPAEVFNTMSTPRGGQYQLILPDGSAVWLNAESSITYPTAFVGSQRKVKITGEVYFEVAHDARKPFVVTVNDTQVEVLGTHFNINAYSDEGPVKTSLLEGSVKIDRDVLKPGQAYMNGRVVLTDVAQDVAWKNGVFNFNDQNLSQVMRQLARWYNLEVVYAAGVPRKEYGGEMGRNLTLEQVLKGLENSGVHFHREGRRLFVKP